MAAYLSQLYRLFFNITIQYLTLKNLQQEIDLILQGGQQGRVVLKHGE